MREGKHVWRPVGCGPSAFVECSQCGIRQHWEGARRGCGKGLVLSGSHTRKRYPRTPAKKVEVA